MKQLLFLFITVLSLHSFAQDNAVVNDANAQNRTLNAGFTSITVSDGIDLYLTQGGEESVAVSASDPKYLERFKTEVKDGALKIWYDNKGMIWNSNEKRKLTAWVSFKTLENLHASAGADVSMKSVLTAEKIQLSFTSGSQFTGQVSAGQMEVSQNSGSEINMTGKADILKVEVSSGALFKGYELSVEYADAKATSGAGIRININKELHAKANSGGAIRYKGTGVIKDIDVNTGGVVKKA